MIKTLIVFCLRWWPLIQAIQVIEDQDYDGEYMHQEPLMKNFNNSLPTDAFLQESIHRILDIKSCGFRRSIDHNASDMAFDSYIVGGKPSAPDSWPWMVAIYRMQKFLCGGTIINARYILTAAHCVQRNGNLVPNYHLKVLIGAHRIQPTNHWPFKSTNQEANNGKLSNGIWFAVNKVIVHENYSLGFMQNDIAMLRLNSPLHFQQPLSPKNHFDQNKSMHLITTKKHVEENVTTKIFYQPICLPAMDKMPANHTDLIGHNATIIGWGHQYEGGDIMPILNEVQVPIISNEQCRKTYGQKRIHQTKQICALHPNGGKDSCQGDSGGGMMATSNDQDHGNHTNAMNTKSKRFYQIGIVSWGRGCARPNIPGVYTRVSEYLDWILEQVQQT